MIRAHDLEGPMDYCRECGDETVELTRVKVGRRIVKLCEQCADERREKQEIVIEATTLRRVVHEFKE
jgi:hypothetical protein